MALTARLGGSAKDVIISKVGTGLMLLTWTPTPTPDEQAFAAIKASLDALPAGAKMLLNSGQFYAHDLGTANLELLSRFFEKYPEYADKAFLSVKGGTKLGALQPDPSEEGIRASAQACLDALRGKKKIDLFELARVDRSARPFEDQLKQLSEMVKEGLFDHIGISECSAQTVREANAIIPVASVEIEISPWSYEEETKKVIATAGELGIAVIAYSPLGRGFLTGTIDTVPNDMRAAFTRFQEENLKRNKVFVDALKAIGEPRGISSAELSLAWVSSRGSHVVPIPGSSKPERIRSNINAGSIALTEEELAAIAKAMEEHTVHGTRYIDSVPASALHLWG